MPAATTASLDQAASPLSDLGDDVLRLKPTPSSFDRVSTQNNQTKKKPAPIPPDVKPAPGSNNRDILLATSVKKEIVKKTNGNSKKKRLKSKPVAAKEQKQKKVRPCAKSKNMKQDRHHIQSSKNNLPVRAIDHPAKISKTTTQDTSPVAIVHNFLSSHPISNHSTQPKRKFKLILDKDVSSDEEEEWQSTASSLLRPLSKNDLNEMSQLKRSAKIPETTEVLSQSFANHFKNAAKSVAAKHNNGSSKNNNSQQFQQLKQHHHQQNNQLQLQQQQQQAPIPINQNSISIESSTLFSPLELNFAATGGKDKVIIGLDIVDLYIDFAHMCQEKLSVPKNALDQLRPALTAVVTNAHHPTTNRHNKRKRVADLDKAHWALNGLKHPVLSRDSLHDNNHHNSLTLPSPPIATATTTPNVTVNKHDSSSATHHSLHNNNNNNNIIKSPSAPSASAATTNTARPRPRVRPPPGDDIAKKFSTHPSKKGWLICKKCFSAVWPPNCRKHSRCCE